MGQIQYSRNTLSGQTYTALSGGGITIINTTAQLTSAVMSTTQDDGAAIVTLPFTFTYNGNTFTTATFCTNGWVGLGSQTTVSAANSRAGGNLFNTTEPFNVIAPWYKDMGANFPTGTGSMRHGLIGTDVYAFQWNNAIGSGFTDGSTITISFQVNIYGPASTNPGRIQIIYGPTAGTITTAASIGIKNAVGGSGNFINALDGSTSSTTTSSAWPGNGNGYQFDPLQPCTAPGSVTGLSVGSATVSSLGGSYTAPTGSPAASGYLVVRYPASSTVTTPVNGTPYALNATLGLGRVVYVGTATSFTDNGLTPGTSYDYYVYAYNNVSCIGAPAYSTAATATAATLTPTLSGTKTVGSGGDYANLTTAFNAINTNGLAGNIDLQLTAGYPASAETYPIAGPSAAAGNGFTIKVYPTVSGLSITSANATGTLNLNGSAKVLIDGRVNQAGSRDLVISNTNTGTSYAIQLTGDANNNTIQYCTITSRNTSATSGTIVFGATSTGAGVDNNTIDNCDILDGGGNPVNAIYSAGASAVIDNSGNNITNCNIANYFSAASATAGILLTGTGNSSWNISNNRFYQTASRTYTTANIHYAINIGTGSGYTINNNTIGFANSAGTGNYNLLGVTTVGTAALASFPSSYTLGTASLNATRFVAINASFTAGGTASNIQGNTIANIGLLTSSGATGTPGILNAIVVNSGNANIGSTTGNTIGATSGQGSLYAATSTAGGLVSGIFANSTGTLNIQNNSIGSVDAVGTSATTSGAFVGIDISSSAANVTLNNNNIGNTTADNIRVGYILNGSNLTNAGTGTGVLTSTTGTSSIVGIRSTATGNIITINGNNLRGWVTSGTVTSVTGIAASGTMTGTTPSITANTNLLGAASQDWIRFAAANSGALTGISVTNTVATAIGIQDNVLRGITYSVAGSGSHTYLTLTGGTAANNVSTISGNQFNNLNVNTTGSITFISHSYAVAATGTQTINNNSIVTAFNKGGAGGTITLATSSAASSAGAVINHTNNNFSNITVTGATTIAGWVSTDGGTVNKNYSGNTFSNWTGGTSAVTAMSISFGGGNGGNGNTITGNTISNISAAANITAISIGSSGTVHSVFQNTINTLNSSAASGVVTGIAVLGTGGAGSATHVYRNKIYDLSCSGATPLVTGISVAGSTATTTVNIYNNLIGDIRAVAGSNGTIDVVRGIGITNTATTSNINVFFNTIRLAGSGGANFSSSGVFHTTSTTATTAALNLRNNIIINLGTPSGTGVVSALRRSSSTLTNFAATSNKNLLYAGVPGAGRAVMFDGTTSYINFGPAATAGTYLNLVTPRDLLSFNGEAAYDYTAVSGPTQFFQSITGSDPLFLHVLPGLTTQVESGADPISTPSITNDFDGDARNASKPDIGADEFAGTSPAPVISNVTVPTFTCTATAHVINADVVPTSGTLSTIILNYNNGSAGSVAMTLVSGNTYTGTIPAASPANANVTWSITATNSIGVSTSFTGTSYADEPLFSVPLSTSASVNTICAGGTVNLSASLPASSSIGTQTTTEFGGGVYRNGFGTGDFRHQLLYTAAELTAAGIPAGNITSIAFNVTSVGSGSANNYTIRMANSPAASLGTTFTTGTFTTCYTASTYTAISGNNVHTFTTPFSWDGTSNVLVDICYNISTTGASSTLAASAPAFTANNNLLGSTGACSASGGATTYANRPIATFGYSSLSLYTYAWSDGTSNISSNTTVTVNPTVTTTYTFTITRTSNNCTKSSSQVITVNALPAAPSANNSSQCGTGVPAASVASQAGVNGSGTFKWYNAPTAGTLLQTSTSATYTTAISTTTTFYVSEVGTNGCESARTPVTVTVNIPDAVSASASPSPVCVNSNLTLTATVTGNSNNNNYTYSWAANTVSGSGIPTPPLAGGTGTFGTPATTVVTPTAAGTYTYTVTAVDGTCTTISAVTVTVAALPVIDSVRANPTTVCANTPVTLNVYSAKPLTGPTSSPSYGTAPSVTNPTTDEDLGNITITQGATTILNNTTARNSLVGTIGTATGTAGSYSNFTAFGPYTITAGLTYNVSLTSLDAGTAFSHAIALYIDYNRDGDYADAGENVYNQGATISGAHTSTGSFTVPVTVSAGYTRMRAIVHEGTITSPTLAVSYGEFEEYTINLVGLSNQNPDLTYTWSTSQTGATVSVNPNVSPTQTYTVTAFNTATGCTSASSSVSVAVTPQPAAPAGASSNQCGLAVPTAFVVSQAGLNGTGTFNWYDAPTGGNLLQSSASSTFTTAISTSTTFYVSESGTNGCQSQRTPVTVSVNAPDAISASASPIPVCANSSLSLTATVTGNTNGNNYAFTWAANSTTGSGISAPPVSGGNGTFGNPSSTTITPTVAGTYTYTVTAVDGSCTTTSSVTVTVTALPVIDSVRANPTAVCANAPVTLNVYAAKTLTGPATSPSYGTAPSVTNPTSDEDLGNITITRGATTILNNTTARNSLVGTIGTATGTAGSYSNFTAFGPYTLNTGLTYNISLTSLDAGTAFSHAIAAYIDYNRDGDFVDAGENVYNQGATISGAHTSTGSFTVPATASVGYTRMRVIVHEGTITSPTLAVSYGEFEEYTINLIGITTQNPDFTYTWSTLQTGATVSVNPIVDPTQTYTVTAFDAVTGCTSLPSAVSVTVNPIPADPATNNAQHCGTIINTNATATSNSGAPTPVFNWYDAPAGGNLLQSSTLNYLNIPVGTSSTFYVAELSAAGCLSGRVPISIATDAPDALTATSSTGTEACVGEAFSISSSYIPDYNTFATFDLTATGGAASGVTGTVSLTPNATGSDPFTITPTAVGTYTYTVSAFDPDKGCTSVSSVTVIVRAVPVISSASASPAAVCEGLSVTLNGRSINGGAGNLTLGAGSNTTTLSTDGTPYRMGNTVGNQFKNQYLFLASELQAAGLIAGNITSVQLTISGSGGGTLSNFSIRMGTTAQTALTTTYVTGLTPVLSLATYPATGTVQTGLQTHTFTTPFNWDGTSNIVLEMCAQLATSGSAGTLAGDTQPFNATILNSPTTTACGSATGGGVSTVRPRVTFGGQVGVNNTSLYNWEWNPGNISAGTTGTTTVTPGSTTTYTVTATDAFGCSATSSPVTVTVNPLPAAPSVTGPNTACGPRTVTLNATGSGGTFKWYNVSTGGTALSTAASFSTTVNRDTTFYVSETSAAGCEGPRTAWFIDYSDAPTLVITPSGSTTFCVGGSVTLDGASGSDPSYVNFSWSPSTGLSANNTASVTANPTNTTTYTLSANDGNTGGCSNATTITITVNPNPVITTILATPNTICAGGSSVLSATSISGGANSLTLGAGSNTTTLSTDGTPYRVGNTVGNQFKNQYLFLASELQAAGLLPGNITSVQLTVSGSGGGTLSNFSIRMGTTAQTALTTTYVTGLTQVLSLSTYPATGTLQTGLQTHTFTTPFNWDGTSNIVLEMCAQLATSGSAGTLAGDTQPFNATILNSPTTTACGSATGGGVSTVRPRVTFGGQVGVNNTASFNWVWNPGNLPGSSVTVNPVTTTSYTVTATNPSTLCTTTSSPVTVTVAGVTASASATSTTICSGASSTLSGTATGGGPFTYAWDDGVTSIGSGTSTTGTIPALVVTPTVTTTYTLTVLDACNNQATSTVTVTVNPLPTASVQEAGPISICFPSTQTLTAVTNAASPGYQWQLNGANITSANASTYVVSGVSTGAYSVVITDGVTGCISTASSPVTVTINQLPAAITLSPTSATICNGSNVSITANSPVSTGAPVTSSSGTISVAIPDNNATGITNNLTVSGIPTGVNIDSVIVQFSVTHSFVQDLVVSLQAPNGQIINLAGGVAPTSTGSGYTNARISSDNSRPALSSGTAPYTGTFRADRRTTAFQLAPAVLPTTANFSDLYSTPNGVWRIRIHDDESIGSGTLTSWSIKLAYSNATPAYSWTPATGLNVSNSATVIASPSATTTYTVTATTQAGCSVNNNITVNVNPRPTAVISGGATYCAAQAPATTDLTLTFTGTGPWAYTLSNGSTGTVSSNPATVTVNTPASTTAYTVTALSDANCASIAGDLSGSATITVNPTPATPTVTPAGPVTICASAAPVVLTSSSATGNQWYKDGNLLTGETGQTLNVSSTGSYTVIVTNGFSCSSAVSSAVSVTVNPNPATPAINAGGPVTFCAGGSVVLSSSSISSNQWNINGSPISGETNQSLTVTASGNYSVTVSNGFGCTATSVATTVTVNPLAATPTATVTQPTCAVATGSVTVTAPLGTGNSYTLDGTTTITWPAVTFTGVAPGNHTISVSNSFGCFSPATASVTVNPQPFVPGAPVVSGLTNVCPFVGVSGTAGQVTYTATATGFGTQTFNWILPPNTTLVSGQGTNTIVVSFASGFTAQANKQIRVTATNQCGTSVQTIYYLLAQFPNTPGTIVASTNDVCPSLGTNVPITYTIPKASGATSYIWTAQSGTTTITHPNGLGVNDTTVTVTFTSGFTTSAITVKAVNTCGTSGTRSLTITRANPGTPSLISGPTNVCAHIAPLGTPATYTVPLQPAVTTYTWTLPAGATSITGQGTNTISFIYPAGYTGGSISVIASNGCGASSTPRTLTLSTLSPATPSVIDVINTVTCEAVGPNREYTYSLAGMPANATSVQWTIPAAGTLLSGQGSSSITVSYPPTAVAGTVTATAFNNCGSSVVRSVDVKLAACPPEFAANSNTQTKGATVAPVESFGAQVFPNPTVSDFRVRVSSSDKNSQVTVRVLDLQGRELKRMILMPDALKSFGSDLKAGAYMIEVLQGKNRTVQKLIKL